MMTVENANTGSTGNLGLARRSYQRWYLNYPDGAIEDIDTLTRLGRLGSYAINRRRGKETRGVARMLVSQDKLEEALCSSNLSPMIEAAVPTGFASPKRSAPLWMVMGSVNHATRRPLRPLEDMVAKVDVAGKRRHITPYKRITQIRDAGYTFISAFSPERISEVLSLWKDSFEWDLEGVRKLEQDLVINKRRQSSDRSIWFSGILEPASQRIVALATAERLNIPIDAVHSLPIVETTEWRRADGVSRHGLTAAAVAYLNGQIIHDLRAQQPLIVAETNFMSEAHQVGFAAGMDVPPRQINGKLVSQMLIQNVRVGDGHSPDSPRDFTMMHLPSERIQTFYDAASTESMLKGGV